ncbi:hypothetical protein FIBSPDRAFT_944201 [Athelia psychrophila]|uniref:Uncharacterized protein n=1 Tax=Athelia psychrophila TaxID=1759441 RepID=A0A166VG67_9AGAM|nr:hypothetical protein FIBSPDRAFT_944201 [Fibularhizoctonia sp. CBS 109695]
MSLSKNRAPASPSPLALVFAGPEQGAQLESVTTKLPAHPSMYSQDSVSTLRSLMLEDSKDVGSISEEPESTEEEASAGPRDATKSAPDVLGTAHDISQKLILNFITTQGHFASPILCQSPRVDKEVPRLNISAPFDSPHPPSVMPQNSANGNDGEVSMSSLNPSASRFTL